MVEKVGLAFHPDDFIDRYFKEEVSLFTKEEATTLENQWNNR